MTGPVPSTPEPAAAPATGAPAAPAATTPPVPPQPPQPAAAEPVTQGDPAQEPLGLAGIKALEAERQARRDAEARLRELEPLATKAQQLEEAGKTEAQRLTETAQTATATAADATRQLQQMQAALAAAPEGTAAATVAQLAGRIQGATPEEMQADAAVLFQLTAGATPAQAAAAPAAAPAGQTPVEALRPGALPTPPVISLDQQIADAEAKGETALAMQLKSAKLAQARK